MWKQLKKKLNLFSCVSFHKLLQTWSCNPEILDPCLTLSQFSKYFCNCAHFIMSTFQCRKASYHFMHERLKSFNQWFWGLLWAVTLCKFVCTGLNWPPHVPQLLPWWVRVINHFHRPRRQNHVWPISTAIGHSFPRQQADPTGWICRPKPSFTINYLEMNIGQYHLSSAI